MKAFLTFALLGPLVGGCILALFFFFIIAISGNAKAAASMSMLCILFSPIVGFIPAVTTFILVRTLRGARQGKALQWFAAIQGFMVTAAFFMLVVGLNKLADIHSATPLTLNTRLITDLLVTIVSAAVFGVLGMVSGYLCARVGYGAR